MFSDRKSPGGYTLKYFTVMTVCTLYNHALTCDSYFVDKHIKSNRVRIYSAKISPRKYLSLADFLTDEKLQPG